MSIIIKNTDTKKNNFDFLRLLFASFVIITHSYPIAGFRECDYLCELSKGQVSFSHIGVKGFFVISGYLIFQSLQRSQSIVGYFWKRILRLFPALFIVLLLTIIFLAPSVYEGNSPLYYNKSWLTYLPKNLSLYLTQYEIDGVFENNPYKSAINGSLWTIPYEFTLYVLLSFLIVFKKRKLTTQLILLTSFLLLLSGNVFYLDQLKQYEFILGIQYLLDLGCFFVAGSLLAAINIEKVNSKKVILIFLMALLVSSIYFDLYRFLKYLILPILFILLGLYPIPYIQNVGNKLGDLSYGIYIYGFPVQQTFMYYYKFNYLYLMIFSLIVTCVFAYFSWHLVEKRALKFKSWLQ